MEILIFCQETDIVMHTLYRKLHEVDCQAKLVTDKDLAFARYWNHSSDEHGNFNTTIGLIDGTHIDFSKVKCIVNRIVYIPMFHFVNVQDRQYAEMEMYALFLSLLKSNEPKLLSSIKFHHIGNIQTNNRFFLLDKMVRAGLPIQKTIWKTDSTGNSADKNMIPFELKPIQNGVLRKKSAYEMLKRTPTIFLERLSNINTVECVCGSIVQRSDLDAYREQVARLLDELGYPLVSLKYGYEKDSVSFISLDCMPKNISSEALSQLMECIINKTIKNDFSSRNTKRATLSISH